MKRLTLILFVIACGVIVASAQNSYKTYANDRFFFSIEYPSSTFVMQTPPANNDGRTFRSKDGKAEVRVWGGFNALDRSLKEEYDNAVEELGTGVTYKVLGDAGFVVSGIRGGKIYYRRTLLRRTGTEVFYSFTIEYPKSQKAKYDAIVSRMSRSFKFDPDAEI